MAKDELGTMIDATLDAIEADVLKDLTKKDIALRVYEASTSKVDKLFTKAGPRSQGDRAPRVLAGPSGEGAAGRHHLAPCSQQPSVVSDAPVRKDWGVARCRQLAGRFSGPLRRRGALARQLAVAYHV